MNFDWSCGDQPATFRVFVIFSLASKSTPIHSNSTPTYELSDATIALYCSWSRRRCIRVSGWRRGTPRLSPLTVHTGTSSCTGHHPPATRTGIRTCIRTLGSGSAVDWYLLQVPTSKRPARTRTQSTNRSVSSIGSNMNPELKLELLPDVERVGSIRVCRSVWPVFCFVFADDEFGGCSFSRIHIGSLPGGDKLEHGHHEL